MQQDRISLETANGFPRDHVVNGAICDDEKHVSEKPECLSGSDGEELEKKPKHAPLVIFCISCITFISCYLGGLVTISVPQVARDLNLDPGMELWYYVPDTVLLLLAKSGFGS